MDVGPLVGDLAVGGISGWCAGYFIKKVAKVVAFILGGYTMSLYLLARQGIITIHGDKLESLFSSFLSRSSSIVTTIGLIGAGAVPGFYIGWRSG